MLRVLLGSLLFAAAVNVAAPVLWRVGPSPAYAISPLRLQLPAGSAGGGKGAGASSLNPLSIRTDPSSAFLSFQDMAPGDQLAAPLRVTNEGSVDLVYSLVSLAANPDGKGLAHQIQLTIQAGSRSCTGTRVQPDGTIVYGPGPLDDNEGSSLLARSSGIVLAQGRLLHSGEGEMLCFHVALPLETSKAFAGATSTVAFKFVATQTLESADTEQGGGERTAVRPYANSLFGIPR